MRVACYFRISEDRDGTQTATDRQREDCLRFARQREWEVVEEFEDIDLSAWKRTVKRPAFEEMLKRTAAGEFDVVLAWKFDRVLRSVRDFARLQDAARDGNAYLVDMFGLDTSTSSGKMQAGMMAVFAEAESDNISIRVSRKHEERAKNGLPQTGGHRLFGYTRDRMAFVEEEAQLVREAVTRIIGGESLRGVCFDWASRGILTTTGKPWQMHPLKRFLSGAAIAGVREHRGRNHPGAWPALISEEQHRVLSAILLSPARATGNVSARKYLLAGMAYCGVCLQPTTARPGEAGRRYVCAKKPGRSNCGGIARPADRVEEVVFESIAVLLEGLRFETEEPDDGPIHAAIEADQQTLVDLSRDYYQDKAISAAEFFANRNEINARIEENRRLLTRGRGRGLVEQFVGAPDQFRQAWEERGLEWRRAFVAACIDRVLILPAGRSGPRHFRPELVKVEWKF